MNQVILSTGDHDSLKQRQAIIDQQTHILNCLIMERNAFMAALGIDVVNDDWEVDGRGIATRKESSDGPNSTE